MFINYTFDEIFDDFGRKYKHNIYEQYPHLLNVNIHYCYSNQYSQLDNVPVIEFLDNDLFAFSCCRNKDTNRVDAYIIYSPDNCNSLNLTTEEKYAAISHEIGHIIHFFNESLNGQPEIIHELKADEVVSFLGLSNPLSNLLSKLITSNYYTEYQKQSMKKRRMFL